MHLEYECVWVCVYVACVYVCVDACVCVNMHTVRAPF